MREFSKIHRKFVTKYGIKDYQIEIDIKLHLLFKKLAKMWISCVDFNQFYQDHLYSLYVEHLLEVGDTRLMSSMIKLITFILMENPNLSNIMPSGNIKSDRRGVN